MHAIIYAAKSTKDKKGSIPDQLKDGRAKAKELKMPVAAEFEDEDKSAYHGNRGDGLRKAMAECERIAPCALIVQRSDRLARGDVVKAQHLSEVVVWAIKHDVTLISVLDPAAFPDTTDPNMKLILGGIAGMSGNQESAKRGESVKKGIARTVERGEWRGSAAPEGFVIKKTLVGSDTVRWVEKHPEDSEKFELIWRLDLEGRSAMSISLELDRRGWMTRPSRRNLKPQRFSVTRVRRILNSPTQAGQQVLHGKTYEAAWDGYIDPDAFWHRKAERAGRAPKHGGGRPQKHPRLLTGLAVCGLCGAPAQAASGTRPRKDGSRRRLYVCKNHRYHHKDSPGWCQARPWEAAAVDAAILASIEGLLGDAATLREQLETGQRAEREKLERVAAEAVEAVQAAEHAAERATAEFADAEDADERALLKDAAMVKRAEAKKERTRADAALDALNADQPEPDTEGAITALWARLQEQVTEAGGDVRVLNAALRESFAKFELYSDGRLVPTISPDAAARFARHSEVNLRRGLRDDLLRLPAIVL
jgi:DNA invertase Pin-like site-specific DNA recombinase